MLDVLFGAKADMEQLGAMDLIFLVILLLLLLLPTILMTRGQKKRQQQVQEMQASLRPGDRIVNVAGFHGTVVATNGEVLEVEIAPNTVVEMEVAGVMKKVEDVQVAAEGLGAVPGSAGEVWEGGENSVARESYPGDELPGEPEGGSKRI